MNCSSRTYDHALPAQFALGIVDICDISLYGNRIVRTSLGAESATDAGCLAGLTRNRALILVHTRDIYAHSARSLVAEFDD